MSSKIRQNKMGRLIQKELSSIFQSDYIGSLQKEFVTVTEVQMSPDLGVAKVYISMMLAKDRWAVLGRINKNRGEIRRALGVQIGKQVRLVPQIMFIIDESEERASHMESVIKKLNIPPADDDADLK